MGRKWACGGLEEAQNDDFDRKLTQMDANGGGNCPRSEVRSPRSGGRRQEKWPSSCFPVVSCFPVWLRFFVGRRSENSYLREFASICGREGPENGIFSRKTGNFRFIGKVPVRNPPEKPYFSVCPARSSARMSQPELVGAGLRAGTTTWRFSKSEGFGFFRLRNPH